jgi:hypothetical protein
MLSFASVFLSTTGAAGSCPVYSDTKQPLVRSFLLLSCKAASTHACVAISCYVVSCRIYSDELTKDNKQSLISWLVAVTTLTIYTGWMHVLIGLMLCSFFSRTCFYVLVAVWSTTFLPAKPVLWNAFCRSWVSQQQQIRGLKSVGTVGLVAVWSTTFLPAKPVLWNAFRRSWGSQQQQLQHMQQESAGSVEAVTGKANSLERLPANQEQWSAFCLCWWPATAAASADSHCRGRAAGHTASKAALRCPATPCTPCCMLTADLQDVAGVLPVQLPQ